MEDKEIGSYTREDFDKRLRGLERHVKASQVRLIIYNFEDAELASGLKHCNGMLIRVAVQKNGCEFPDRKIGTRAATPLTPHR